MLLRLLPFTALWACGTVFAAGPALPVMSGELSGDFTPLQLVDAPSLHWALKLAPVAASHEATLEVDGPGSHLRAAVTIRSASEFTWRILEGRAELKTWLAGPFTRGTADVTGTGTLVDGVINGEIVLHLRDVDLGELVTFSDPDRNYVKTARGTTQGVIRVQIKDGVASTGDSALTLPPNSVAQLTFVPSPGLLTQYVPGAVLKQYPGIEAIELGQTPLEAKVLRLVVRPDGDRNGHSARLAIQGRPVDPKIIAPLDLEFNFNGPWETQVRRLLTSRLKFRLQ